MLNVAGGASRTRQQAAIQESLAGGGRPRAGRRLDLAPAGGDAMVVGEDDERGPDPRLLPHLLRLAGTAPLPGTGRLLVVADHLATPRPAAPDRGDHRRPRGHPSTGLRNPRQLRLLLNSALIAIRRRHDFRYGPSSGSSGLPADRTGCAGDGSDSGPYQLLGGMFWLSWKTLSGSSRRLRATSRSHVVGP
jgi:hypothetical protein